MALLSDLINLNLSDSTDKIIAEYVWIGGSGIDIRSKARTISKPTSDPKKLPKWNYDGSSTGQAPGEDSEVILYPQAIFRDPFRRGNNILVMCDTYTPAGDPIPTNKRHKAAQIFSHPNVVKEEPWFGIEQEYTLLQKDVKWPLGWPVGGYPGPQGPYYCGVGVDKAFGRDIVDAHYKACLSLTCLADLFLQITSQKKKTGAIAPKRFVQRLKKQNEIFRSFMHQDAHEFLNYLLNELVDILEKEARAAKVDQETSQSPEKLANGPREITSNGPQKEPLITWVHKNFQGILTNETRCLCCETVTARDETFLDLSLDIEQNSSITSCLKNFSSTETLNAEDKFFCDKCCSLQEAQKRMKIKKPPHILVIHLKRFKYMEQLGRYKKLSYRVVFPLELKLSNTVEDVDAEYSLFAVVVHVGSGPNHGHYVSLVKSHNRWLFFDDENVEMIDESAVQTFFGSAQEYSSNNDHGYILFYERLVAT